LSCDQSLHWRYAAIALHHPRDLVMIASPTAAQDALTPQQLANVIV